MIISRMEVLVMATIRPSSDLRNKYNEISEFCHKYNEPVFITKNGTGDLVVMSNAEYERLSGKQELYRLLGEGLTSMKKGTGHAAEEVFAEIEREFSHLLRSKF
jgi:prevent-host-death family protein